MSCPYFREGYFGICVAPDAVHVPNIQELENFCFRRWYARCPSLADSGDLREGDTGFRKADGPEAGHGKMTSA